MGGSRTLLVDSDIYLYQATAASEQEINWGGDLWTLHSHSDEAYQAFLGTINGLQESLAADRVIVALSHRENFRSSILPTYKHNRQGKRKPVAYTFVRSMVMDTFETFERPGLEADDVLGILSTAAKLVPGEKIVVTEDKDLKTIPGKLYFTHHTFDGVLDISPQEADYWHFYQTLIGDTTDGYTGCPGIGPKTAEKLLGGAERSAAEMWEVVVKAYEKAGLTEEDALVQARVARICRVADYDFTNKRVIPWEPPR